MDKFTVFYLKGKKFGVYIRYGVGGSAFVIGLFYGTIICEFVESRGALWN